MRRYDIDVTAGRVTGGGEIFATCPVGAFDGFRLDVDGRIWTSGQLGVHCYDSDGTLLGTVRLPETCANVEFGGSDRTTLFMTATSSLYALQLAVTGARGRWLQRVCACVSEPAWFGWPALRSARSSRLVCINPGC